MMMGYEAGGYRIKDFVRMGSSCYDPYDDYLRHLYTKHVPVGSVMQGIVS